MDEMTEREHEAYLGRREAGYDLLYAFSLIDAFGAVLTTYAWLTPPAPGAMAWGVGFLVLVLPLMIRCVQCFGEAQEILARARQRALRAEFDKDAPSQRKEQST